MSSRFALTAVLSSTLILPAIYAAPVQQSASPVTPAPTVLTHALDQVSQTIAQLNSALEGLNIQKWKISGSVRQAMLADVQSVQSDASVTLPRLISTAQASPSQVSTALPVYRNVDALYDVLLRLSETASLAGSRDAVVLEQQRAQLEVSRTQLSTALLATAQAQEAEMARLRTAANPPASAKPAHVVVDDGPTAKSKPRRRRTTHPAPQMQSPSTAAPN